MIVKVMTWPGYQRVPPRKIVSIPKLSRRARANTNFVKIGTATLSWSSLISGTKALKPKLVCQPRARTIVVRDHWVKHRELVSSWAPDPPPKLVLWIMIVPGWRQFSHPFRRKHKAWSITKTIKATFQCQRSSMTSRNSVIKHPQSFDFRRPLLARM